MYKEKYLKYKTKYLDLKNEISGEPNTLQDGGGLWDKLFVPKAGVDAAVADAAVADAAGADAAVADAAVADVAVADVAVADAAGADAAVADVAVADAAAAAAVDANAATVVWKTAMEDKLNELVNKTKVLFRYTNPSGSIQGLDKNSPLYENTMHERFLELNEIDTRIKEVEKVEKTTKEAMKWKQLYAQRLSSMATMDVARRDSRIQFLLNEIEAADEAVANAMKEMKMNRTARAADKAARAVMVAARAVGDPNT